MTRQPLKLHRKIDELLYGLIRFIKRFQFKGYLKRTAERNTKRLWNQLADLFHFAKRHVQRAANILYSSLCCHGTEGDDLCNVIFPVF